MMKGSSSKGRRSAPPKLAQAPVPTQNSESQRNPGVSPTFRVLSKDSIRDRPVAPRSPWQNAYVERLIGSIRRECLDHMIVFGEAHLRRILGAYAAYYNESRTHRSLNKDACLLYTSDAADD